MIPIDSTVRYIIHVILYNLCQLANSPIQDGNQGEELPPELNFGRHNSRPSVVSSTSHSGEAVGTQPYQASLLIVCPLFLLLRRESWARKRLLPQFSRLGTRGPTSLSIVCMVFCLCLM